MPSMSILLYNMSFTYCIYMHYVCITNSFINILQVCGCDSICAVYVCFE